MSGLNYTALAAKVAGLALCGFMTACGQSNKEATEKPQAPSLDKYIMSKEIGAGITEMALAAEAKNINPNQADCNYMLASIRAPGVEVSREVHNILYKRCPN